VGIGEGRDGNGERVGSGGGVWGDAGVGGEWSEGVGRLVGRRWGFGEVGEVECEAEG
jgi:hypothetical protein